jgi:phage replication-related protein YjqB (UPF0714/DUF867 family)
VSSTVKNTSFNEIQRRFLKSLSVNSVKYLIVGGYAVGFHGHPRLTRDLDVWVGTDADNAEAILEALNHYGIPYMLKETFMTPNNVVQLGEPPNRIDILTSVSGVTFQEAYIHKQTLLVNDLEVTFIDLEGLIQTKPGTGRARDAGDIEDLQRKNDEAS